MYHNKGYAIKTFSLEPTEISTFVAVQRSRTIKRIVEMKHCDDDDNIRTLDDHTLISRIVVQGCPCEKRFKNNQTRFARVSDIVSRRFQTHLQKLYFLRINYPVNLRLFDGNTTHTLFDCIVEAPKSDHVRVKFALKQTCKDDQVSHVDKMVLMWSRKGQYSLMCAYMNVQFR